MIVLAFAGDSTITRFVLPLTIGASLPVLRVVRADEERALVVFDAVVLLLLEAVVLLLLLPVLVVVLFVVPVGFLVVAILFLYFLLP